MKPQNTKRSQAGFTLIEVMIVVALCGILASIAIPQFQMFYLRARRTESFVYLDAIHKSQLSYFSDRDEFVAGGPFMAVSDMKTLGLEEMLVQGKYKIQAMGFLGDGSLPNPKQAYAVTISNNIDPDPSDFDLLLLKYHHSNYPLATDGISWLWRDDLLNKINNPF